VTVMPRSIPDILDRADELVDRLEAQEPDSGDECRADGYVFERADKVSSNIDDRVLS
jgi:hypothetical protein